MKKILLILLFSTVFCSSQMNVKFNKGVHVLKSYKTENFINPKSILFEFSGDTHLVNYYSDLAKKIKKQFRKRGIKSRFNFNLYNPKPLESDVENIPNKKYVREDFDLVGTIELKDFKSWDNHLIEKRRQNHKLNIQLRNNKETVFSVLLDIYTHYTIATQNKDIVKTILHELNLEDE